jgi:arsenate reductase
MNTPARELIRTKETLYRELNPEGRELTDDEAVALLVEHPALMQRPIVERGERAVLGRPVEKIKTLLHN